MSKIIRDLLVIIAFGLINYEALAYETDQYSTLFLELNDSVEIMDKAVNDVIETTVAEWRGERDDIQFANLVEKNLNARQMENWINVNPLIDSWNKKEESIYKTLFWFNSPIIRFKGLANTFKMAGVQMGADKLSHFFGVGGIYYRMAEKKFSRRPLGERMMKAIKYGKRTEHGYWGELTTNVFSNADLVVNYEGMLFFYSLFIDNVVPGKKAIIKWVGNRPTIARTFSFTDHVNDFWSESLLPSKYQISISHKVKNVLRTYCTRSGYLKNPERFLPKNEQALVQKYSHLGINWKAARRFRMDTICGKFNQLNEEERKKFLERQSEFEREVEARRVEAETGLETDANEEGDILEELGSALPGCMNHMRKAVFEHKSILDWNESISSPLAEYTESMIASLEVNKLSFDAIVTKLLPSLYDGETPIAEVMKTEAGYLVEVSKEIENGEQIVALKTIIERKADLTSICIETEVPLKQFGDKLVRMNQDVRVKNCFAVSSDGKINKSLRYKVVKEKYSFWSNEAYYPFASLKSYLYRNIPYFCKWY